MELYKFPKLNTLDIADAGFTRVTIESVDIGLFFYDRLNEYPSLEDTLKRDYIDIGRIVFIDSITGLKQTDYTGAYDYSDIRVVKHRKSRFIILSLVDTYIYGTDQQVYLVVFKEKDNKQVSIVACYTNENDSPTEDIVVVKNGSGIELRGLHLLKSK